MLPKKDLAKIKNLLHQGKSHVAIGRATGRSPDIIGQIARHEYESPFDKSKSVWCDTCRCMVHPPCLACRVRDIHRVKPQSQEATELLRLRLPADVEQRRRSLLRQQRAGCPHCGSRSIRMVDGTGKGETTWWWCMSCEKKFPQQPLTASATVPYTCPVMNEGAVQEARQPLGETG